MSRASALRATEIKAFVPARDFALSRRFFADLGFTECSVGGGVAPFSVDGCAVLPQDFYEKALAENLVMHVLVPDVGAWRARGGAGPGRALRRTPHTGGGTALGHHRVRAHRSLRCVLAHRPEHTGLPARGTPA
jgi:hypothetical protein